MKKAMSVRSILGLSTILCLAFAMPARAKGKTGGGGGGGGTSTGCSGTNGTGSSFNVTSSIFNLDGAYATQLQNDGTEQYTAFSKRTKGSTDSVTSEIQANSCDWVLDLTNSTSRTVKLSLGNPVNPSDPNLALPEGWPSGGSLVAIPAQVMTNCVRNPDNGSTAVGNMTGAQTIQCGLHVTFNSNGTQYAVRMNPLTWDGATWGQATCTDPAGTSPCSNWTITPGEDVNGDLVNYNGHVSGIGELVLPPCDGCSGGTAMGLYYLDFSIAISKP
jgi:hypothetical protein